MRENTYSISMSRRCSILAVNDDSTITSETYDTIDTHCSGCIIPYYDNHNHQTAAHPTQSRPHFGEVHRTAPHGVCRFIGEDEMDVPK